MKNLKKILLILFIAFVIAQFYPPKKNEMTTIPETDFITITNPPQNVQNILKMSCYDCHSNTTNYPWYNHIVPVSYWLVSHVDEGKEHLNFSLWGDYSSKQKAHKLEEIIEEVKQKHMPLNSYLWMHADAKLTDKHIKTITDWATPLQVIYEVNTIDAQ